MSDQDNQPPQAPVPPSVTKKTSAVPLKKETVRVTLKADPETPSSVPAPSAAPTPPTPSLTATAPLGAPKPPAPAPTIALRTAAPAAPGAAPAPAPTIALRTGSAAGGPPVALRTQPLATGGAPGLPKATVQLAGTQPLPAPSAAAAAPIGTVNYSTEDDSAEASDTMPTVLSIVVFVLSLIALGMGIMTWLANEAHTIGGLFS